MELADKMSFPSMAVTVDVNVVFFNSIAIKKKICYSPSNQQTKFEVVIDLPSPHFYTFFVCTNCHPGNSILNHPIFLDHDTLTSQNSLIFSKFVDTAEISKP